FADDLWLANVDKGQIHQVFSNLTINANQAMPDGGHLYICMENAEIAPRGAQKFQPRRYIRVSFRDEGIGIDRKHLKHIFDPYYSTKKGGNGLGLATVYSIIEKHGGHISVDSEPGRGTRFTLYLPASGATTAASPAESSTQDFSKGQTGRILVMDNEAMIRQVVCDMLETSGYAVETATEGETALTKYKQAMHEDNPFDAVIMDLTVPGGMGGADTIKELLAVDEKAKAIVSSGYSGGLLANYRAHGFAGIITKPYTIQKLQQVLDQVLQG
ncbi:MAG: response regulator, partial [Desulfobacterales bacterium]|nr:response regulator [Desulfobacterales bacterium]